MTSVDVLVVGAGPTGLTLACELARRGVACRVIDKAPSLFMGSRAKGLQPRTLEVFDDLGVIDAIQAGGMAFPPFRLYAEGEQLWERTLEEMLRVPAAKPSEGVPHPRAWLIPQWRTDRILHDRLVELGRHVDFSTELCGLSETESAVVATLSCDGKTEQVSAQYLVGADGGRSFVRKAAGFSFEGTSDSAETTLIGDVRVLGLRGPACHIFTRSGNVAERISLWDLPHSDFFQLVATLPTAEVPELSLEGVRELFRRRSGRSDITLSDLRWISRYQVKVRMVDRLRRGRVLLAGDAAHVHSPAGGQGLNTGVQDAYNLGWKLASALVSERAQALLATYEEERLPVAARVLALTSRLDSSAFRVGASSVSPALDQLDISYSGGALAFDDGSLTSVLRAGDRAPDASLLDGTRLFDHFRGSHFTLLAFGLPAPGSLPGVRVLSVGRPLEPYGISQGFALVRPDGHLAALSSSLSAITGYLQAWGVIH